MSILTVADVQDGRTLRREQNREATLDALSAMFREGQYQPTVNEVAARAGVSLRSLFRYFDDVDDLSRAAIEREMRLAAPLFAIDTDPTLPLGERIARSAEARMKLFEAVAPAARAARSYASKNAVVAQRVTETRRQMRNQLRKVFAAEIGSQPDLLPPLDVVCSFESYDLLRGDQGLSRPRTKAALIRAMSALLKGTP